MSNSKLHIVCECGSMEHQMLFIHDHDDDEMYLEIHLANYRNFFKRLWVGLKYAFGYKSQYGNFDSTILSKEDRDLLLDYLAKAKASEKVDHRDQSGENGC